MTTKVRMYIVSIMAFSQLHPGAPAGGTYVESRPALIPAETIDLAAERAREFALEIWPMAEPNMWYGHGAAIQPVPSSLYEAFRVAAAADVVDDSDTEEAILQV